MAEFVTVEEVKEFLNLKSPANELVQAVIDAAIAHVQSKVAVPLGDNTVTVRGRARAGGNTIFLPIMGATELRSITDPNGIPIEPSALADVDVDAGVISLVDPAAYATYTVTVAYPGARADLKEAVLHIIKHLWSLRRGAQGGVAADVDAQQALQGFAIPRRAEQLIAPYAKIGGFA